MRFPKSREEGSGEIRRSAAKEYGFKLGDAKEKQRIGCLSDPAEGRVRREVQKGGIH